MWVYKYYVTIARFKKRKNVLFRPSVTSWFPGSLGDSEPLTGNLTPPPPQVLATHCF